jgi:hypothetical protein
MSDSRKNKSMTKSSKFRKNIKSSRKTRKNIRKMRGGVHFITKDTQFPLIITTNKKVILDNAVITFYILGINDNENTKEDLDIDNMGVQTCNITIPTNTELTVYHQSTMQGERYERGSYAETLQKAHKNKRFVINHINQSYLNIDLKKELGLSNTEKIDIDYYMTNLQLNNLLASCNDI